MRRTLPIGLLVLALAGCGSGTKAEVVAGADPGRGRDLIVHYGCGACHRIGGVAGADAVAGPPLTNLRSYRSIMGLLPNTPANLARWIENAPKYLPGGAMPDLGVRPGEAKDIAAYLETQ